MPDSEKVLPSAVEEVETVVIQARVQGLDYGHTLFILV